MKLSYLLLWGLFKSKKIIRVAGWGAYGFFIGIFYFVFIPLVVTSVLQVVNNNLPSFPSNTFPLMILLGYLLETYSVFLFYKTSKNRHSRIKVNREVMIYWGIIILYFCVHLYILFGSGILAGGHWYSSRGEFMRRGGSWVTLLIFALWGMRLLIVSYTFELLHLKRITLFNAGVVAISVMIYEFLFVGNRIVILMYGIAGFFYVYREYGKKILVIIIGVLAPIMLSLGVYQDVRAQLFEMNPLSFFQILICEIANQNILLAVSKVFESADLLIMLDLFNHVGGSIKPIYGSSFLKVITWMIPRSLWLAKPLSATVQIGNVYLPGSDVPLVPLFWGEVYYNFGLWGLVVYPIILWLLLKTIELFSERIELNFYLQFLLGFLAFRLPVSDVIVAAIILMFTYKTTFFLWKIMPKKKPILHTLFKGAT